MRNVIRHKQKANPTSPNALFGFATCIYTVGVLHQEKILGNEDHNAVFAAFQTVKIPANAEFARMRWLLTQETYRGFRELGERLLEHNAKDFDVMYDLVYLYLSETDPKLKRRGFELADLIVKTFPRTPGAYSANGDYNYIVGVRTKSWPNIRTARDSFKRYLDLAPASSGVGRTIYARRLANVEKKIATGDISGWKH